MKTIEADQILEAAVNTLVNGRCRRAYLHDLRGGLQAISGALELLARLARCGKTDPVLVDRASAIAKSALANHERAIVEMLNQVVPEDDVADTLNLGEMIDEILQFLRNDIASKQIRLSVERSEELKVLAQKHLLRLLMLGLFTQRIDECPTGGELVVRLERAGSEAVFALSSAVRPHLPDSSSTQPPREPVPPRQSLLEWASKWLSRHGGRMELLRAGHAGRSESKLYYPLQAVAPPAPVTV